MTQEEILQYNKRCAEFLGAIYSDYAEAWGFGNAKNIGSKMFGGVMYHDVIQAERFEKELKFDSDWNWIMEVKNHIIGLGYCWFQFPDTIQINENFTISSKSICKVRFDKLQEKEAVVEAINKFLIWYEQNKTV